MVSSIQNFILRNIENIPYFLKQNNSSYLKQSNYALIGKLSASIIHDILTPICSLELSLEIKDSNISQSIIKNSSKQIKEFVEIMKDFLKSSDSLKTIHINKEIFKCIKLLSHKALIKNVQIQFIEFNQIHFKTNPLYIYQIIINLLSNAIDASALSNDKKVILMIRKNNDSFQIDCKDFGPGIAPEIINKIFTANFTTKKDGCGLGLYSVNNIVTNILKGNIYLNSEPNNGSLFSCTIPL